ncbi:MAG: sel1 repeat family protein [Gammaproteobacteria bacterium]|nr:sel1 repeat family protein [Gammaproteobacteria bacterium]
MAHTNYISKYNVRIVSLLVLFLLVFTADSIIHSPQQIQYHYSKSQSYVFSSANYGNEEASLLLYKSLNDLYWLELSAQQGSGEGAFLWSQIPSNKYQEVWLQRAIQLQYAPAVLFQLQQLTRVKNWSEANQLLQNQNTLLQELPDSEIDQLTQLKEIIHLALVNDPINESDDIKNWAKTQLLDEPLVQLHKVRERHCNMVIQPVLEQPEFHQQALSYQTAFASSSISDLAICFNEPKYEPLLASLCRADSAGRASCTIDGLMHLSSMKRANVQNIESLFSHLLVITEQGEANVRGGIMLLDKNDDVSVFMHELTHWLGLVDEYPLSVSQANLRCETQAIKQLGHNVVVANAKTPQHEVEQLMGRKLYKTNTCNQQSRIASQEQTNVQAYKYFQAPSVMEYLDITLSTTYAQLIKDNLRWHQVNPVWFSLYEATEQSAASIRQAFITHAAVWGNGKALMYLADKSIKQRNFQQAKDLLYQAAEFGDADAQIKLGHAYLEGEWLNQNFSRSAFWYQRSAEQSHHFGLYFYGKCLEMGWGCEVSINDSLLYYQRAAMFGNSLAERRLEHHN